MRGRQGRVFYGWWVVSVSALGLFLGGASITMFSFGIFLKPLSAAFHSSRASISLAFTLHNLVAAASILLVGRLVDRYGARKVILTYTAIFGAILLSNEMLSGKLWQLYVFYMTLGFAGIGAGPVPYTDVVSHWFDRRRGLALGLMMLGPGFGAMIMPLATQKLISRFGWHIAYAVFGFAVLLIALPIVGAFLKERPEALGLLPDGVVGGAIAASVAGRDQGVSWREARHSQTFWLILGAFCLVGASTQGCMIHMVPLLTDRGISVQAAVMVGSLAGGAMLLGKAGSGYLLDRFFGPYVAGFFFAGVCVGIGLLWMSKILEMAFPAAFLIGLGLGAETDILGYLVTFRRKKISKSSEFRAISRA